MDQSNSSILSSSFLSQLISQKLNHSNYLTWKRQIVPFIKSHRLYGHIDGTTPAPPQYIDCEVKRTVVADQGGGASTGSEIRFEYETVIENNPAYEVWLAHDQSLVAYITSNLSEEVLGGVNDNLTALELWSTLATTYSQVSEARTHAMQGHRTRPWTPQAGMGRGILPTPPGTNTTSSTPRRVPTCFYCNKRGHVKSKCWHNPQNKNNHIRREGKAAAGAASSSSGQNVTPNIPADAQQLLMTAISKLQLKQNEQGEWYVDSGAAAHVTGDTGPVLPRGYSGTVDTQNHAQLGD
ncbi:hypothetical protein EJ110_NYTH38315 [Nymphaea thermarum]|nr:hypothetical protein EJ110_NYTH38315 [Nymphaea thermarum]